MNGFLWMSLLLAGTLLPPELASISFGFLYTWGLVMAFVFRKIMARAGQTA